MVFNRMFKKSLATILSASTLCTFHTPAKAVNKKEALGIGGGALAGATLIATSIFLINRYHKNNDPISKFESMGDGNTFRIDNDVKRNADPRTLALILETFYDIFEKYPSLVNYMTKYNQRFAAANFQSCTISERGLPVNHYHLTIKSFDKMPEDYLHSHATEDEQHQWNDSQISVVKNRLQNYFITTDPTRLSIYLNLSKKLTYDDLSIKKIIAFAIGTYIYDMYSQYNYTKGEANRCLFTACQPPNSALLISESDFDSDVAPLILLNDTNRQDESSELCDNIWINRSHFGTLFMRSIYEEYEIDQTYVEPLEKIFKTHTQNLHSDFNELRNQGFNQVGGNTAVVPKWWFTVPQTFI